MTDGEKSVDIQIASDDLRTLKDNGYKLCFAKKVNDTYNVVWQSADDYDSGNSFSWTPLYALFGSNTFKGGVGVHVTTQPVEIGLGKQVTLDKDGIFGKPSSGGPDTGITMLNEYRPVHPGLSAVWTDSDGKGTMTPIYVAEAAVILGSDVLTPVEAVQVWFEQDVETSTMFSTARSKAIEIDLTTSSSETRLFSGGKWSTPALTAGFADPVTILTIIAGVTGAVIIQDLVAKIASKLTGVYKDVTVVVTEREGQKIEIKYREQPRPVATRQLQAQSPVLNPIVIDQLSTIALEAFVELGVGYTTLDATPGV